MDSPKQEIVEKLQAANNILVTVSTNPSVDQLSACIGLTLLLNKLDKHATAVFSGNIPDTIEFLKPEDTIEKNTNSLRDFIIALDKAKADKLRYKVEDKVVKIFITPYRTSLSADDLDFSQGDFNVDIVLALGVHNQTDLDEAITAHGRILHDATVMCVNTQPGGELGSLNWVEPNASSLSELATELAQSFEQPLLDQQIATALLTGIVAETDRFRNEKTTATTMTISADLMKAGANQQLVAEELDHEMSLRSTGSKPKTSASADAPSPQSDTKDAKPDKKPDDGTLEITHESTKQDEPQPAEDHEAIELPSVESADHEPEASKEESHDDNHRALVTEPPTFGGQLTANDKPDDAGLANVNTLQTGSSDDSGGVPAHGVDIAAPKPESRPAPEPVEEKPAPSQQPQPPEPKIWHPPAQTVSPTPSLPPMPPPPTLDVPSRHMATAPAAAPAPPPEPLAPPVPPAVPAPASPSPAHHETLTELEEAVESPHVDSADDLQKARDEVMRALNEQPSGNLPPIEALNAQPVDLGNAAAGTQPPTPPSPPGLQPMAPLPPQAPEQPPMSASPADKPLDMPLPPGISVPPAQTQPPTNSSVVSPNAPPPVPPPMVPPQFGK
jgi:hypothetical protein